MAIELELLLPPVDVELRGVGALTHRRGTLIRFGLFDPQPREVRLDLGHTRGRRRFALARAGQARPRRLDGVRQLTVAPGKQHFFPTSELVPQPLVSPRLRRLTLQRATLFLDFE